MTEIDSGYFDKLLVAPVRRTSLILGRLGADLVRGIAACTVVVLAGFAFGVHIESGVLGTIVLILLAALFGVAYAGFGILVALTTRNVQATNTSFLLFFPLLFLTPNFVPFDRLSPVMETLARLNPVSYVIVGLRSLILDRWVDRQDPRLPRGHPGDGRGLDRPVAASDRDLRPFGAATIRPRADPAPTGSRRSTSAITTSRPPPTTPSGGSISETWVRTR